MKKIDNITTINNIEEAKAFIEQKKREKKLKKNLKILQNKINNLIDYVYIISDLEKELGIYSLAINNDGTIMSTVTVNNCLHDGLAINIEGISFKIKQEGKEDE